MKNTIDSLSGRYSFMTLMVVVGFILSTNLYANQQYPGGSLADSPWVGVTFKIPSGFNGNYNQEAGALIIKNNEVTLAVYGVSQGDLDTVGELVVDAVKELGIQLVPVKVTRPDATTLDATFSASVNYQPRSMLGTVRKGPYNNVIAIMGLAKQGQDSTIRKAIQQVTGTLKWRQPQGSNQSQRLAGKALYRSGGSSDGRSGPGGFTASTNTKTQIDFCSNGLYGYQSVSESIISTPGTSMPSRSNSSHQGRWWLVADLGGGYYVYLESNQNKYYIWPIYETSNGANLNGMSYSVSQSQRCY